MTMRAHAGLKSRISQSLILFLSFTWRKSSPQAAYLFVITQRRPQRVCQILQALGRILPGAQQSDMGRLGWPL